MRTTRTIRIGRVGRIGTVGTVGTIGALMAAIALLAACDKRDRKASGSSLLDSDQPAPMGTTNVYRFVGVEQSLTDARKAAQEERWEDAIGAAEALLREQPSNTEAQSIRKEARLELPNQQHYNDFVRTANGNEVSAAVKLYRTIAEGSVYREKARVVYEKMRQTFLENQEAEVRALARAGRCDEARRGVRVANDWFPDARGRIDDAATGCRPARGSEEAASAAAEKKAEREELASAAQAAPAPSAPAAVASEGTRGGAAEPPRTVAAAPQQLSTRTTVSTIAPPPVAVAPAPSAPAAPPRNVPATEIEKLRTAGDASPSLPAGAKMIAHRDGVARFAVAIRFCVSEQGIPTTVSLMKASEYSDANEKILGDVRRWRFRPYIMNGVATPVCSALLLNYEIE